MPELRRISARVTVRKGTSTQWELTNPVLLEGELGWESNTRMLKVGDGTTPWKELKVFETSGGGVNSAMVHDGTVFPSSVTTPLEAIEHTQRKVNVWEACAMQDFADGYDDVDATCQNEGTLV